MKRHLLCLLASIAIAAGSSVTQPAKPSTCIAATQPSSPWQPARFPISFWCGPEPAFTTLERYQQIKDAGFTFVMPPCHGMTPELNRKVLDYSEKVGLKAFIQDARLTGAVRKKKDPQAIDAAVADYASHPALAGYLLVDEPIASQFPTIAAVVSYLKQHDPQHVSLINLFPNTVAANLLQARSYDDYLRQFESMVKPFVISYDHYSLQTKGDDRLFIANLAAARQVALNTNLPFWNIVQVTQWQGMRNLTAGELEYQAMQSLALGAKGIIWFTYWTPVNDKSQPWSHAMIAPDGMPTEHYAMVQDVNRRLLAIGNELLDATSTGFFQTGTIPPGGQARPPADAPIDFEGVAPPLTVGLFRAADDKQLILVASSDYKAPVDLTARFTAKRVERFDASKKTWAHEASKADITLPPGAAALFRIAR